MYRLRAVIVTESARGGLVASPGSCQVVPLGQVREAGESVLGPLHLAEDEPDPAAGSPISRALRRLGVLKGDHFGEFAAVGLGRRRDTDDWLGEG
ncbi:hypothetical protein BS329_02420 [Amycolatopsis coloradensis]|uniref:Uncharacterized protein n=1 Tax=Amycolatopsis coloradensis TaxID=76021 RepID=A0A1R0L2A6_9PSEU|nr:hypothetical protein [Amycolatopsis coloradensis]OLZ56499.1 hypothetical protein BS329_02420 [Amycolatopsis coloradensis]